VKSTVKLWWNTILEIQTIALLRSWLILFIAVIIMNISSVNCIVWCVHLLLSSLCS
jgi:hypothetical protein